MEQWHNIYCIIIFSSLITCTLQCKVLLSMSFRDTVCNHVKLYVVYVQFIFNRLHSEESFFVRAYDAFKLTV